MDRNAATARVVQQARRNGGVITRTEILCLVPTSRLISDLVRSGVIRRKHRGVYVLGGTPDDHYLALRAALAAVGGPGRPSALASHASAAWLQGLVDHPPTQPQITGGEHHRRLSGVVVHRSSLANGLPQRQHFHGIPSTRPARTLLDLASLASAALLADAVDRALARGLVPVRDIEREMARYPRRRGTDQLRRCLAEHGYTGVPSPSVLEGRMARLLTRFGLPRAKPQCIAGPNGEYRLDYAYPQARLMMELYGYTWHHSPEQMASDLARQRRLTLEGWTPLIFTWQDVTDQPERVAEEIRRALHGMAAPGPASDPPPPNPKPLKVDNSSQV